MQDSLRGVIGILGFGVDGKCVAEFLEKQKEIREVRVFDDAQRHPDPSTGSGSLRAKSRSERANPEGMSESKGDETISGKWKVESGKLRWGETLDGIALLFRSPGFKLTHPLVIEAKKRGIPIASSTTYFLQNFSGKTVGITGSNGKTTCTALIAAMLRLEFGKDRVEEGGNDRVPRLDLLGPNPSPDPYYAVLELSSFQLIDCPVSPHVAVVLNITPNHLDWHMSMEEYIEAKRQIVAHPPSLRPAELRKGKSTPPQIAVLNLRDPIVKNFVKGLKSTVRWFEDPPSCTVRCRTHPDTVRAAVTAARALDVAEKNIVKVLETFPGIPHRLEFVRELNQVKWYNDSSCTTPESAIAACEAFPEGTVVLLLGGRDKGMNFSKLYEVIKQRNVRVVPYGEMAPKFLRHLPSPTTYPLPPNASFKDVIAAAHSIDRQGDNVILSPACASFDMFANAKERGEIFVKLVKTL